VLHTVTFILSLQFHSFLTWVLVLGELTASRSCSFTSEKVTRYPMNRKLCRHQCFSGNFAEDTKIFLRIPRFEAWVTHPVVWSVYRLRCPSRHICMTFCINSSGFFLLLSVLSVTTQSVAVGCHSFLLSS
jgi:hypothetical protein